MFNSKTKYYYCFRGSLTSSINFFIDLQAFCLNSNIPVTLITFLSPRVYLSQIQLVKQYRSRNFKIIFTPFSGFFSLVYFFFAIGLSSKTVIHLKKQNVKPFIYLKKIFGNKLTLITDLEGDYISELNFLSEKSFSDSSYKINDKDMDDVIDEEKDRLRLYDQIFVHTGYFKNLLTSRHPELSTNIKIAHLMTFVNGKLRFDEELRKTVRQDLGWHNNTIITYIGNVYYPWQNLSKTIKLYKRIKNELHSDAKLLLLIKEKDKYIANEFAKKNQINNNDYLCTYVDHKHMIGYLSAADVGVVLRDFHDMNKCATSGKILDYLGCGLPIITTSVFEFISNDIKKNGFGLILDNLKIDDINIVDINRLIAFDTQKRKAISVWANENLSLDKLAVEYISTLAMEKND